MDSLSQYLGTVGQWGWFIAAVALLVLETILPGVHFLWFGLAAAIVGALAMATGLEWHWQLVAFGVISFVMVFAVRRYVSPEHASSDEPDLNVRAQQYVGRVVVVEEALIGGRGRVRVGDTVWAAEGPDLPRGASATVTGCNGSVLKVG